jgi:hypothetical protein
MQIISVRKVSRRIIWYRRMAVFLLAAGSVGVWLAYEPAGQRYRAWKQRNALAQARQYLDKKDLPNAKLALDIALTTVPGSPEALRVAAELLESIGSAQAIAFRRLVLHQSPDSMPDRLALASSAIRFNDPNAARDALAGFTPAQLEQPAVLRAHLAYALAVKNQPMADALFDRLSALAPLDDEMKALHAMLLRQHPNEKKSAAAKSELERLAQSPRFALTLNRAFFTEAVAARDFAAARRFAATVTRDPGATLADRLNEASLHLLVDQQPFAKVFAALAPAAADTGPHAAEFVRWLIVQGKAAEATRWLDQAPAAVAGTPEVAGVRAELAAVAQDWDRLGQLVEAGAWGPVPGEVVRLAMSARVVGARNPALRKQVWDEALGAAGGNLGTLRVLLRLASTWQWEEETEALLWAVVRIDPGQNWAHSALLGVFRARGDGRRMLEVMTLLKNAAPTSATYRHDWVLLTLLVSPSAGWDTPKTIAREIHRADPANPSYAATYALALAQAGRAEEARAVIEKLPASDREFPLRAPYLAFVYGHCRRPVEYKRYADLAANAAVLQEERLLVRAGQEALSRPVAVPLPATKMPAAAGAPPKT